ncbi:acyltransferase family protein [Kocuria rosea]|uniref:acyltransferase family protein n=1 Tax=Kocuria rosea TaxID=1275 RepID=UPI002B251C89|nr:acyltransferase family protein [Kocuria rosea]MEB2529093.1 acyltransferase family protein [Kocuria rosea]MEB2619536.1 acyltransferase family protein [Kocuria rosea]
MPRVFGQPLTPATAGTTYGSDVDVRQVARYSGFRPEVQGLRAVAVLLVVVYHVFLGRVSGGVDVFLLISAFFLTLSFVRKLEAGRPLALGRYWLHVFKRLLPLAVLTILATLVAVELLYPGYDVGRWRAEALASVFYAENWALALSAVDYYAVDHSTASPFQHFWSLSVQGQVFLLWPLVFGAAWWLHRRFGWRPVPVLAVFFAAIFAASLAWSVYSTSVQQEFAYFDTRTRLWESALGSLLALALPYLNPPRAARVLLGWFGLVSMVSVGVLVDVQGAFPGWIALWPLASAAAIIVAGRTGSPFGLDRILASAPLVRLGDCAYALYLVHWPLLITYLVLRDRPMAGPRSGVVLVVLSVVLAVVITRLVEDRFKAWAWPEQNKRRLALTVAVSLAVVAVPVLSLQQVQDRRAAEVLAAADRNNPGAAALLPGFQYQGDPEAEAIPVVTGDYYQKPGLGEPCPAELGIADSYQQWCFDTVPNADPAATLMVIGNSHVHMWIPAIEELAKAKNWRVVTYIRGNCMYSTVEEQVADHQECARWLEGTDPVIEAVNPELVLVQGTRSTDENEEQFTPGMEQRLRSLAERGIQVIGLRDNARFDFVPAQCAVDHGADAPQCAASHVILGPDSPLDPVAGELAQVSMVDLGDLICPEGTCVPVIGNVYTYWDNNHLTVEYVRTLAPMFTQRVQEALTSDGAPY